MRAITLTKTVSKVADIKAGDEFRSDDEDGGVILYWIAERDAVLGEDGLVRLQITQYPSASRGQQCAWDNPGHELTVWRPDTTGHCYAISSLRSGVFHFETEVLRDLWLEEQGEYGTAIAADRVDPEIRAQFES